jgi:hypothetical protein
MRQINWGYECSRCGHVFPRDEVGFLRAVGKYICNGCFEAEIAKERRRKERMFWVGLIVGILLLVAFLVWMLVPVFAWLAGADRN